MNKKSSSPFRYWAIDVDAGVILAYTCLWLKAKIGILKMMDLLLMLQNKLAWFQEPIGRINLAVRPFFYGLRESEKVESWLNLQSQNRYLLQYIHHCPMPQLCLRNQERGKPRVDQAGGISKLISLRLRKKNCLAQEHFLPLVWWAACIESHFASYQCKDLMMPIS